MGIKSEDIPNWGKLLITLISCIVLIVLAYADNKYDNIATNVCVANNTAEIEEVAKEVRSSKANETILVELQLNMKRLFEQEGLEYQTYSGKIKE